MEDRGLEGRSPRQVGRTRQGLGCRLRPTTHSPGSGEVPTRVGTPRGLKRGTRYPGCGGQTRHNPCRRWKAVTAGVCTLSPGSKGTTHHTPHTHKRHPGCIWTPPGPLRQKPPRRKGNFRKQVVPHGFNPLLNICRLVGKEFTLPGTGYQS